MNANAIKILSLIFVAIVASSIFGTYLYTNSESKKESTKVPMGMTFREELIRPDSHSMGLENAPLTIVEFLDPECESCKAFYPIMKKFLDEHKAKTRFVVRYMAFHTSSAMAVAALESAALQGKYWEYLEILFETAEEWGHKDQPNPAFFEKYAGTLSLDLNKFKNDMTDPRWLTLVERDMKDGQILGVKGTPTVFFNGDMLRNLDYGSMLNAAKAHLGLSQK
jgi:protein-disulfide isomerase